MAQATCPTAPWKQDPSEVLLCCHLPSPHSFTPAETSFYANKSPHCPRAAALSNPFPLQSCRDFATCLPGLYTAAPALATPRSQQEQQHSGGERALGAAEMTGQGSGCWLDAGARGQGMSFREGRSARPQGRCPRRGDPSPCTRNGSLPAASLQGLQLPAILTLQAQREGREGKNTLAELS